jgi:hypothetical protein
MRDLIKHLLQAVGLVATTSWAAYWFLLRVPQSDWRQFLVALLLAVVLGWWTWIAMGTTLVLAIAMLLWGPEPGLESQMALEVVAFGVIGLLWGGLGRIMLQPSFFAPTPTASPLPMSLRSEPKPEDPSAVRMTQNPMRSNRLMDGHFDESRSARSVPHKPAPLIPQVQPPQPPAKAPPAPMPFHPIATPSSSHLPVWDEPSTTDQVLPMPQLEPPPGATPPVPGIPPAASAQVHPKPGIASPASLGDYGGESVYLPSLPGNLDSVQDAPAAEKPFLPALPPMVTQEIRLGQPPPPRSPFPPLPPTQPSIIGNESSVFLPSEFPTMEMPVAGLLRSGGSSAGPLDSSGLLDDPSGGDAQLRRSGTVPAARKPSLASPGSICWSGTTSFRGRRGMPRSWRNSTGDRDTMWAGKCLPCRRSRRSGRFGGKAVFHWMYPRGPSICMPWKASCAAKSKAFCASRAFRICICFPRRLPEMLGWMCTGRCVVGCEAAKPW